LADVRAATTSAALNNHAGLIWAIADLLRGDYKRAEYQKVILPLVLLRRLDCVLASPLPVGLASVVGRSGFLPERPNAAREVDFGDLVVHRGTMLARRGCPKMGRYEPGVLASRICDRHCTNIAGRS
jgi:hypothetical protein